MNVLVSFLGTSDYKRIKDEDNLCGPLGSIIQKIGDRPLSIYIMLDKSFVHGKNSDIKNKICPYYKKLFPGVSIELYPLGEIINPSDYSQVYKSLEEHLPKIMNTQTKDEVKLHLNITSGTPVMQSVLMLFGKARYAAKMYQSYASGDGKEIVDIVDIPFPLSLSTLSSEIAYEASILKHIIQENACDNGILGNHPRVREAIENATKFALCDFNVLIVGESGTGKELFAKQYHSCNPKRMKQKLISVNCANFPEHLIESELFGYSKGAFTGAEMDRKGIFEAAKGGVLFLDELGEMPPHLQTRLLRVMETGKIMPIGSQKEIEVELRVIAATNSPEKLREDLLYRISDGIIHLPPLRQRGEDVLLIANATLKRTNAELSSVLKNVAPYIDKEFDDSAIDWMIHQPWNGNIRELNSVIKRACALNPSKVLTADILKSHVYRTNDQNSSTLTLPFHDNCVVAITEPIDLMWQLKLIKNAILNKALATFTKKMDAAKYLGFNSATAMNKHLQ